MPNTFSKFDDAPWILDGISTTVEQRPPQDADFKNGETYDGVVWDKDAEASVKQETKVKYVMRRVNSTAKMFKKIDGVYFTMGDISKYLTPTKIQPPSSQCPTDGETIMEAFQTFGENWLVQSVDVSYTKDGNVLVSATFKLVYWWELVLTKND